MSDMSDPKRWADADSDAPAKLKALLADAQRDVPSSAELASLERRLGPEFFAPRDAAPAAASASRPISRLAKLLGLLAAAGVVGVTANRLLAPSEPAAPAPSPSAAPSPAVEAAPPAPTAAPSPPAVAPEPPPAEPLAPPKAAATPKLGEAELLERARRTLAKNPSGALALTEQHRARFPNGVLRQEREVIAIEALRRLNKDDEAKQRAGSFEKSFPDSAHRRSVESGRGK